MPAMRYSTWLVNPRREPSTSPPSRTTIGWNVNGTCVKGKGTLTCAAAAVRTVMNSIEATRIPRAAAWSSTRVARTFNRVAEWTDMPELYALPADNQHVLEGERRAVDHAQAGRRDLRFDDRPVETTVRFGTGAGIARLVIHDPDAAGRFQRVCQMPQEADAAVGGFHLLIHIDDEYSVERALWQLRIRVGAQPRDHFRESNTAAGVEQSLPADPALDGFEHRLLNVFGVHDAVRPHPAGEPYCKEAGASADVRHRVALGNVQLVHDEVRLLPRGAVGTLEQAEVRYGKQPFLPRGGGVLRRRGSVTDDSHVRLHHDRYGEGTRESACGIPGHGFDPSSTTPGCVITSAESIRSSLRASIRPRSSTRSRMGRPDCTDAFAISAVCA